MTINLNLYVNSICTLYFVYLLREDTHKKVFFSGRTTKRGRGGVNPLTTKQKNTFFSSKEKIYKKKI